MPAPFSIDAFGPFAPGHLVIRWIDEPRRRDKTLDELVRNTWETETERARRTGRMLFNGQLARYLGHRVDGRTLSLEVGPTDYANFLATNLLNARRGRELGWDLFSNPVGTSCTPITADGWLLFGRRGPAVAFHAGCCHTIGGGLEAAEKDADGRIDAFASILRELREELGVASSEVAGMECLGLIRDPAILQPELIFDLDLKLTRAEVLERFEPAAEGQEHTDLPACRNEPEAVLPFLRANRPITAVATAALCLHGRRKFGEAWYERTLRDPALRI
ncbi:MAG: hypothetical protein HRF43_04100 [Phycisphaerae bacterium]|jgi:8-oxo-dGTP pyrophosphatase MutT (NUDIX family)